MQLAWALLTGLAWSRARRSGNEASKYLRFAHVGPLMQAPILLGIAVALSVSGLSRTLNTFTAAIWVASATLLTGKDTLNWAMGVEDEFRTRPPGFYVGAVSVVAYVVALILTVTAVMTGLA